LGLPALPAVRWETDNHPLFPDVCAKSGKWFRHQGELFRRWLGDETILRKIQ
jgi:hypothetical protein